MIYARIEAGDAAWVDAVVDQTADILADAQPHPPTSRPSLPRTSCERFAFGWLARPADLAELLATQGVDTPAEAETPARLSRPKVKFYLHLHQAALDGVPAVARAEQLGPMLLEEVRRFLGHAHVDLHPVIDLNTGASVNCYEHPAAMTERGRLRNPGEVFPHAARSSRNTDSDHPDPYRPTAHPPDSRHQPRAPQSDQPQGQDPSRLPAPTTQPRHLRLASPHGLHRRVDRTGTHELDDTTRYAESLDAAITRLAAESAITKV